MGCTGKKIVFVFLLFLVSGICKVSGQMHPKAQILFVKKQVEQGNEPYLSAYRQLIDTANKALSVPHHALVDFSVPGYYDKPAEHRQNSLSLQTDAFNAYCCALAYRLSGNKQYGEKANELLDAWATINQGYSEHDGALVMSYSGTAMIIAAQLLQETRIRTRQEKKSFDLWVANVYRKASNEIRYRKNNWADWGRFGSMLCATYLGDKPEIAENVQLVKSDLFHKIAADGSMPEETRREKNGIWYTYFSLAPITGTCWLIYQSTGENLFGWEKNGISLKNAIDYLYYYNLHPDEWKWYRNPNSGSPSLWPGNLLEVMSGVYHDDAYSQYVASSRPLMYSKHHFAWSFPTLMPLSFQGYKK